ncbi:hypothetical protein NFC81_05655 [Salinispirillum sp. LH 10-3-1]|uniref:Carboxypeptidase regulatory-like domain-containing protein n=1 Tax=Salinispirillum sp. LH 10-3-1 TaxID=2952525 RepID=A0AB38YJN5_9GAMM
MKDILRTLYLTLASMMLVACDPQDGSGVDSRVGLNGLVVDGRIAGATVWVDLNNNNDRDSGEPRAYTDGDGYYSYNPLTGMNYCALPSSAFEFRYCLRHGSSQEGVVIRARGGRDLVTGERLRGTMALRSTLQQSSSRSSTPLLLSPYTSLLAAVDAQSDRTAILAAFDLGMNDLREDFSAPTSVAHMELLANANLLQALQHLLSDMRGDASSDVRSKNQLTLVRAIAAYIAENDIQPLDFTATDIEVFADLFADDVLQTRRTVAVDAFEALVAIYNELAQIPPANDDVREAGVLAAEVMYIVARTAVRNNNGGAVATITPSIFDGLVVEFNPVADREFDLPRIATALIGGATANIAVSDNTLGTLPFPWQGNYLVIGFEDGGDTEIFVRYIDGKTTDTSGPMSTCVRLGDDDDDVRYFRGTWSKPLNVNSWIELEDYLGPIVARESLLRIFTSVDDEDFFRETVEQSILDEDEVKDYTYEADAATFLNTSGPNNSARARPRNRDECRVLFNNPDFVAALEP